VLEWFFSGVLTTPHTVPRVVSLFTLVSYFAIVNSFILMFTGNWYPCCAMALCIVSVY